MFPAGAEREQPILTAAGAERRLPGPVRTPAAFRLKPGVRTPGWMVGGEGPDILQSGNAAAEWWMCTR